VSSAIGSIKEGQFTLNPEPRTLSSYGGSMENGNGLPLKEKATK
jgi:hypothetical protein